MSTKNQPGQFDCLHKIEPDEPYFVLRAKDIHAPTIVWLWAALAEIGEEDPAKVHEARSCMVQMLEWAHQRGLPSVGLGQVTLAAVMELIRACNTAVSQEATNAPTSEDVIRRFLARTTFERVPDGETP